jgi:hypothetical protein
VGRAAEEEDLRAVFLNRREFIAAGVAVFPLGLALSAPANQHQND